MNRRHRLPPGVSRFVLIWGGFLLIVALFITYFVTGGTQNSPLRADDQPKGKKNRVVLAVNYATITGTTLKINVGTDGSQQVVYTGQTSGQFYSAAMPLGDYGVFAAVGGTLYGPDFGQHPLSGYGNGAYPVPFTKVSQSGPTGSGTAASPYVVTTVLGAGSLNITQKISYVNGQSYYRQDWTVQNTGGSAVTYRLYNAGDLEMQSSSTGYGYYNAQFGAVGGKNQAGSWYILFQPKTAADAYMEAGYATIWSSIGNGVPGPGFNNTILATTNTDNGAGLQWNRSLNAAASDTVSSYTTFGATPQFAPSLASNPASGVQGTIFQIAGAGFGASETVLLTIKDQNGTTVSGPTSLTADASGNITGSFTSSQSTTPGTYTASATGNTSGRSAATSFTVTQGVALAVTPATGIPGTTFQFVGTKFGASETVNLTITGPNGSTVFGPSGLQATASGSVTFTYATTAASAGGTYTATATGATSGLKAVATFTLAGNATLAANPTSGAPGTTFQLSGTGFGASEPVTMTITSPNGSSQNTVLSVRAPRASDATGNFAYTYSTTVSSATGTYTATATGANSSRSASTTFKLVAATALTVTPKSNVQGSSFQLSGTGYAANEAINLVITGPGGSSQTVPLAIKPKNSDASGSFTYTYTTTNTAPTGVYTATATGGTSGRGASTTFTITSAPVQGTPTLASNPASGVRGTTFQLSGTNFGANETVNFVVKTSNGTTLAGPVARTSDASGTVSYSYASTASTPTGSYTVTATGATTGRTATATFSVVAAGAVSVSPASAVAGTTFLISGSGFASGEAVNLTITAPNGSSQNSTLAITPRSADASGNFTYNYATSATAATGTYTVTATGATSGSKASIKFTVTAPTQQPPPSSANVTLGVSPVSAALGSTFTLTGQAFGAGEAINLSFTLPGGAVQNIAAVADAGGNFTAKYGTSSSSPAGTYTVVVSGATTHRSATIAFTVSSISLSTSQNVTLGVNPSAGITGTVFTLTGANYGPNETVNVNVTVPGGAVQTLSATTDAAGNFSIDYTTTASSPEGTYVATATGQTSRRSSTVSFVVGALPPASVPEPTTIALVSSGLAALAVYARKRRAAR